MQQVPPCLVALPTSSCNRCRRVSPPQATATATATSKASSSVSVAAMSMISRREMGSFSVSMTAAAAAAAAVMLLSPLAVLAEEDDQEYVKETSEVIKKVRYTIAMDKSDPNVASAVSELRDASNTWVAKYRREKALLGRTSFRDMYSALNAVSGHYISFGPTAPIPAKRKARILEEVDTAEKALLRGR